MQFSDVYGIESKSTAVSQVFYLPPGALDPFELREHHCGRCGCVLRRLAKHTAVHTCHDQQSFFSGRATESRNQPKAGGL